MATRNPKGHGAIHTAGLGYFRFIAASLVVAGWADFAWAECKGGGQEHIWEPSQNIQIRVCINEFSLGFQTVNWGVKNLSGDKVRIDFAKVYTLTCGTTERKTARLYSVAAGAFLGGGNFVGDDIDLSDAFFSDKCPGQKTLIRSVNWEELVVTNLSEADRRAAAEQAQREQEKQRAENDRVAQEARRRAEEVAQEQARDRERLASRRTDEEAQLRREEQTRLEQERESARRRNEAREAALQTAYRAQVSAIESNAAANRQALNAVGEQITRLLEEQSERDQERQEAENARSERGEDYRLSPDIVAKINRERTLAQRRFGGAILIGAGIFGGGAAGHFFYVGSSRYEEIRKGLPSSSAMAVKLKEGRTFNEIGTGLAAGAGVLAGLGILLVALNQDSGDGARAAVMLSPRGVSVAGVLP